ncbi:hypothetical protein DOTSEDRAFT_29237 [Dothistroma septosporum NZE10]|uniref:Uncharacterized protein n=1 Tax=Dothistroma septosporum (strain NZE10 / CBS 128990) TaxID=675120 RepID=M2XHW6_DOTSN|nr:hypothetical protein DOTSEDRAFT_29237 [Dothistroma septosporum NZE10]
MSLMYEYIMLNIDRGKFESRSARVSQEARIFLTGGARFGKQKLWACGSIAAGAGQNEINALTRSNLELRGGCGRLAAAFMCKAPDRTSISSISAMCLLSAILKAEAGIVNH